MDHDTIRCMAGCNSTTTTGISTSFPYNSSKSCRNELDLFDPGTDVIGKHVSNNSSTYILRHMAVSGSGLSSITAGVH